MVVLTNGDVKKRVIDLRSDTTTLPTAEMLASVATAELGDDVYGEDPTVNLLQRYAAEVTGKEAALFMPTGTMANLVAVLAQCGRGGEVLLGDECHIYHYERGGISALGGCVMHTVTTAPNGELLFSGLNEAIRERPVDPHFAEPAMVCIEQTHNRLGGRVLSLEYMAALAKWASKHGLPVHCDGARVFNAAAALDVEVSELAQHVTTMCFCLSKGLAAPAGSLLVGPADVIAKAQNLRKMLGGGMRQVGVLAAPGLVALQQTPALLPMDHKNARLFAEGAAGLPGVILDVADVESNIVFFRLAEGMPPVAAVVDRLKKAGVLMITMRGGIRAVTHLQVSADECRRAVAILEEVLLDLADVSGKKPGEPGYVNISAVAGGGYGSKQ